MPERYLRFFIMMHISVDIANSVKGSLIMTLPTSYLDNLKASICQVQFTKKDGTIRDMLCTLNEVHLPTQTDLEEQIQKRKDNTDVVSAWDVKAKGWRSFRKDSVISFGVYGDV
jgi:hypothetical protein